MSHLALYRKYRSVDFDEVVGQAHIIKTLSSAIENGRHSHAYLFTGPRGVGKTTVARIVAKRLNELDKNTDITREMDIIEIDGASNRGIDEIRSLREKLYTSPSKLKYKIYIIDEVHMLTREAFNALLKSLEEPPSHVVFIFATTEVHKIPETIISRTQRFDFHPISINDLKKQLIKIAKAESIKIEPEAVSLIAQVSRGSFRDAISLLDQLSNTDETITSKSVEIFTGLQNVSIIKKIIEVSIQKDSRQVISILQSLYDDGADPIILTQQLLDFVQNLLLESQDEDLQRIIDIAECLHWAQTMFKNSSLPELVLQVALTKNNGRSNLVEDMDRTTANVLTKQQPVPKNIEADKINSSSSNNQSHYRVSDDLIIKSLSIIKNYNNSLYAVLRGAKIDVAQTKITVTCRFSFHKERINEARNRTLIEKAFSKIYNQPMHLHTEIEKKMVSEPEIDKNQEIVSSALAILGGEIVDGN